MEEYMKPIIELIELPDDSIAESCGRECGCSDVGTIGLPCIPGDD